VRSYLSTCRKQKVSASDALNLLFKNQLPEIFNIGGS
jgi:transposase